MNDATMLKIEETINVVFDKYLGRAIKLDDLRRLVTTNMECGLDTLTDVAEEVGIYIRNNKGAFKIQMGKGGGVRRLRDVPCSFEEVVPMAAEERAVRVRESVHAVFDKFPGQPIKMWDLESMVIMMLALEPNHQDPAAVEVEDYVQHSKEFSIKSGRGGGIRRVCDITLG